MALSGVYVEKQHRFPRPPKKGVFCLPYVSNYPRMINLQTYAHIYKHTDTAP